MAGTTARDAQKERTRKTFAALAPTYDELRFLQDCARRLVEVAPIAVGARVLDVASGTGVAALAAAERAGDSGMVTGIDLSPDMLALARRKAGERRLSIMFEVGDAESLGFDDGSFDVVLCASSLFFIPDMHRVVREWRRVLVPGGYAAFSTFEPSFLQPLRGMWEARLAQYGLSAAALPTQRLADAAACEAVLKDAGFTDVRVVAEQLGYDVGSPSDRWKDIVAGIEGKPMLQLTEEQRAELQRVHLAELQQIATERGLWIDVPVLIAVGRKPA